MENGNTVVVFGLDADINEFMSNLLQVIVSIVSVCL